MHRERSNEVCNSKLDESDSRLSRHDSESESELLRQFKLGISISRFFQLYFKCKLTQCASLTTLCIVLCFLKLILTTFHEMHRRSSPMDYGDLISGGGCRMSCLFTLSTPEVH